MKKHLNLSIPEPCHEDWQEMTPNQQGKFCGACAKTVVDFTKKSVKEIQSFFIENQGKKYVDVFSKNNWTPLPLKFLNKFCFSKFHFQKCFYSHY